jgi:hypothetical protein
MKKNEKKTKKTIEQELKRDKLILKITSIIIVILLILLLASRNYREFDTVMVSKNNNKIFSMSDLVIDGVKYGTSEKEVKKKFGTPVKEDKITKDKYSYKILEYKGLKLTLKENYSDYMLTKVEVTNNKYKVSRNIKVNDKIIKTIKKFKVENKKGTYLYGNYSVDALNEEEIKDTIYLGIRNDKEVVYINRDALVGDTVSNISRLNISYKYGKITKISWSYDFE